GARGGPGDEGGQARDAARLTHDSAPGGADDRTGAAAGRARSILSENGRRGKAEGRAGAGAAAERSRRVADLTVACHRPGPPSVTRTAAPGSRGTCTRGRRLRTTTRRGST